MKRIISLLMSLVTAVTMFTLPASAAQKAKAKVKVKSYEGYSVVSVIADDNAIVRYTTDGTKPTSESKKFKKKLKIKKDTTLRLRVWRKGYKTAYYKTNIDVKEKRAESDFETLLNEEELNPMMSGTELDRYVEKVLEEVVDNKMTTSEKVKACYDWLVDNIDYKVSGEPIVARYDMRGLSTWEDYILVEQALFAFKKGYGVCDNFAAAFVVLCRAIGVEAYWAVGECKSTGGGYTGHSWAVIIADGEIRQYDPMLDAKNGKKSKYYERENKTDLYRDREIVPFSNFR